MTKVKSPRRTMKMKKAPTISERFLTRIWLFGRRTWLLHLSGFPCHTIGVWIVRNFPPQTAIFCYLYFNKYFPVCKEKSNPSVSFADSSPIKGAF